MNNTDKQKRVRPRSFYAALLISLAMIGAACAYAYQATTATLEENLDSLQNELTAETEAMTEPEATQTTQAALDAAAAGRRTELPLAADEQTVTEAVTEERTEAEPETEAQHNLSHVVVYPVQGEVLSPFSNGELVKSETTGTWQTHNGTDLAAAEGTPVCAADNGTVSQVTKDPLWGICVELDHGNGIVSRYCSLSPSLSVQEGDTVESGQIIGSVGNTADAECKQESHLHFEVRKNGIYTDPVSWLSGE